MEFINGVPLFSSMFLFISFLIVIYLQLAKTKKKLNLTPSPPQLPIIGNIHQFGKLTHHSHRDLAAKHGSLLLLKLGYYPALVVSSADMAKEAIKRHDAVFSNRLKTTASNILLYGGTDIAFSPYDEYWETS
ncbi:hypothetical protein V6N13_060918 [Hibiscus sabdariffa]|uniref:Cytochrome P450 n=2 Tax=Hibiscus sabdariffa TaxID=183260 RepID=A0ABR2A7L6_9ROSI